jgi:hypothetical protein
MERASPPIQDLPGEPLQRLKTPRPEEQHAKQDMQPGVLMKRRLARPEFGKPSSGRPNNGKQRKSMRELARSALGTRKSEQRGVEKRKELAKLHERSSVRRKNRKLRKLKLERRLKRPSGMSADEPETPRK